MTSISWYLHPWGDERHFNLVTIDPSTVSGQKGIFGQTLFLPYGTHETLHDSPLSFHLLSLEGWIGWSGEDMFSGKLRIPSQIVSDNPNQVGLQVPITHRQIEAIEETRKGSNVNLTISLIGQALIIPFSTQIDTASTPYADRIGNVISLQGGPYPNTLVIERERWLTILNQLGMGNRRLIELPDPRLPRSEQHWTECIRLLDDATRFYQSGEYEQATKNCRSVAEGIPHVLCTVWGLPEKPRNQSTAKWIEVLESQLIDAWKDDSLTPGMLRTMLTGAWRWLAPTPHYGTGIPLREDVAFALGLCTDLLSFAGKVLQAHPHALIVPSEQEEAKE